MRTNAIIRIIAFSLGIVILTGILITGLGIRIFSVAGTTHEINNSVQAMDSQSCTADPAQIKNIEIEWASGSILIEPSGDTDKILVSETDADQKYRMVCKVSGDTLSIRFSKNTVQFPSFGDNGIAKDLIITVPSSWFCSSLEIDAASANVQVRNMAIGELDFDGASGMCTLDNCRVRELDVDAASGDLIFSGTLDTLDFDGASADCTLMLTECPSHINLDGMSGNLDITLPSDCGFTVNAEGWSCDFSTDFDTTNRGGVYRHGDGSCVIELDALSGCVTIHKGGYHCHTSEEDCADPTACTTHSGHHSGHH